MKEVSPHIAGYSYGTPAVARSPVTTRKLDKLKASRGFTEEQQRYLKLAAEGLAVQTERIVQHRRSGNIAGNPNLARHSRRPEGTAILEIALQHTSVKKNQTDEVRSTPFVPPRDVIAFTAVMNETIKPHLAAKGNSSDEFEKMHRAWCQSIQIQRPFGLAPMRITLERPTSGDRPPLAFHTLFI